MRLPLYVALALLAACGEQTQAPTPPAKPGELTLPDCFGTLLSKTHYTICHDGNWLIPEWVGYVLRAEDLNGPASRSDDFRADPALPAGHRAELADYQGSGYDRGHMAPAGDFNRSSEAMTETFFLSNMAPQTAELNRGPWEQLESFVRARAAARGSIQVFTGNLFLDAAGRVTQPTTRIGSHHVAVPTHCWKALLTTASDGQAVAYAFLEPNDGAPPSYSSGQTTVDALERLTGFDFFATVAAGEQARVESETATLP